jgi:2',3'-cyclic-nucleotide 2'-phosphodiesterase/3'-nucleotidase
MRPSFLALILAAFLGATAVPASTALAQPAATKPAPKSAPKPAAKPSAKAPPPAPAAPALPKAGEEQLAAAGMTYLGRYDCDFGQVVEVLPNPRFEGYVDVRLAKQQWTMKPVLSSTGALRLEDVRGRTLMLQIANKSMLMDVQAGRRLVDECLHEKQRVLMAAAAAAAAAPAPLKLRILETTDVHMNLVDHDYYQDKPTEEFGLVRTATLIKAARAEVKNTLLFDNGDLLQGSPLGDYVATVKPLAPGQVHPAHKLMRALRYDAANVGNHEFNYGLPFLGQALASAGFPYVNANIYTDDGRGAPGVANAYTPYVILERTFSDEAGAPRKLKVGVIGFVPPQVMLWDRGNLLGRVVARDIVETARLFVPRMQAEGADIIVAIAHSGFERGETVFFAENAVARLAEVPGVDAILFGHSHGEFPGRFFNAHPKVDLARGTINGVPAVMAGRWGDHLGVIDLTLSPKPAGGWQVTAVQAELRPIVDRETRKPLVQADAELAKLIATEHEGTLAYVRSPVARTTTAITSYFAQVADDPSVRVVAQAQLAYARRAMAGTPDARLPLLSAAAPFKSGGRQGWTAYTDIPAGAIAVRNVADLYVYPNLVKVVKLTGAQVREWLEFSAQAFNRIDPAGPPEQMLLNNGFPSYNFDSLDGLTYRIDITQPARYERSGKRVAPEARRIVDLRFEGRPVSDDMVFAVVTNNYRASGGGNVPGLDGSNIILDTLDEARQAVADYLQAAGTLEPAATNHWKLLPVPGVKLRFLSGAGGIPHLAAYPQIRLVKDNGDGSALFEINP